MTNGDPASGGLFRPLEPVAPFDMSNQVRQHHLRPPQAGYPGESSH